MSALPPELARLYPFEGHWHDQPGGRMHYLDEGARDAPAVVCVHGNPTWSFYWRRLVLALRDRLRVIVPDHLGCGLSDKPQTGFGYRLQDHVDNLRRLLDHLRLERASLVVHDWGGAIGMGAMVADPERADRIVVTNTAAFRSRRIPPSIALVKIPGFGALAVRGLNAFARAATVRATEKGLTPEVKRGLTFPYDSWRHRVATLRFVQDIPLHPAHPSWSTLTRIEDGLAKLRERPMLLLWGDADWCFGPAFRREWARRFPDAEVEAWPDVGHYVMEDAPDRVIDRAGPFLRAELAPHDEAAGRARAGGA